MRLRLFDGGIRKDIHQYFSQLVFVVIVVGIEPDTELLKSEISFSLSLHYNCLKLYNIVAPKNNNQYITASLRKARNTRT